MPRSFAIGSLEFFALNFRTRCLLRNSSSGLFIRRLSGDVGRKLPGAGKRNTDAFKTNWNSAIRGETLVTNPVRLRPFPIRFFFLVSLENSPVFCRPQTSKWQMKAWLQKRKRPRKLFRLFARNGKLSIKKMKTQFYTAACLLAYRRTLTARLCVERGAERRNETIHLRNIDAALLLIKRERHDRPSGGLVKNERGNKVVAETSNSPLRERFYAPGTALGMS